MSIIQRIVRRLRYEGRCVRERILLRAPLLRSRSPLPEDVFELWDAQSALPGDQTRLPWYSESVGQKWRQASGSFLGMEVMMHEIKVLSADSLDVSRGGPDFNAPFENLISEIKDSAKARYRRINWYADFSTGHEFKKGRIYFDGTYRSNEGFDIKVPWELSRFQHLPALAHCDLESGASEFLLQVLDWIEDNPFKTGVNWTSELIVSTRVISWIWALRLFEPIVKKHPRALRRIIDSIYDHGDFLEFNLAYSDLGTDDHYLGNITALLYISSAFPRFPRSDRWLLFALQEIVSEMKHQVLGDGYSHMMSSHYHRFVTELFLSSACLAERIPMERRKRLQLVDPREHRVQPVLREPSNIDVNLDKTGQILPRCFYQKLRRMVGVVEGLTKPSGEVPQFGDNDSARAHKMWPQPNVSLSDHRHLVAVLGELLDDDRMKERAVDFAEEGRLLAGDVSVFDTGFEVVPKDFSEFVLPDAGIIVKRNKRAYLAVTSSQNGYRGLGGHGHNDKLSIELSVDGVDVVVDGGCPFYTSDISRRNAFRATSAHSTISIEGMEQDGIPEGEKGLFRLPQKSEPKLGKGSDGWIEGTHRGYGVTHTRRLLLNDDRLTIFDHLVAVKRKHLRLNLHPEIEVCNHVVEGNVVEALLKHRKGLAIRLRVIGALGVEVEQGYFGKGYGIPIQTTMVVVRLNQDLTECSFRW